VQYDYPRNHTLRIDTAHRITERRNRHRTHRTVELAAALNSWLISYPG
jgi:hypothetical protein